MPRLIGRDGRLRVGLLLGAVLAASSVLALTAFFLFPRTNTAPKAAPTAPAAASGGVAPSPSVIYEGGYDPAPTGCLGGQARDTAMVLATQKKAGHSTFGAVEVAASLFRWGYRYPHPKPEDVSVVRPVFDPRTASRLVANYQAAYFRGAYVQPLGGDVKTGTAYYLTTANGEWIAAEGASKDEVAVSVKAHYVLDGSYSVSRTGLTTFVMTWVSGAWHLNRLERTEGDAQFSGGTSFTSGC